MSSPPQERPVICIGCGSENRVDAHFCEKCRAPLTSHAVTDPMASIFARGYMVGKATSKPQRPIVVLGIWLMFGPALVWALWGFGLMSMMVAEDGITTLVGALATGAGLLFLLAVGWVSGTIMYKTTTKYMEQQQRSSSDSTAVPTMSNNQLDAAEQASSAAEENSCLQCGQLIPPEETTCPKCGWSFEDAE